MKKGDWELHEELSTKITDRMNKIVDEWTESERASLSIAQVVEYAVECTLRAILSQSGLHFSSKEGVTK